MCLRTFRNFEFTAALKRRNVNFSSERRFRNCHGYFAVYINAVALKDSVAFDADMVREVLN